MQTVTKRLFLTGICVVAFHILSLNARIPSLIFLSVNILIFFVIIALITLIGRVTTRYYNRLHLKGMRNQIAEVAKILENYEPKCMPPGSLHEMPSEGEDGVKLQQIRDGVEALEARTGSLDEATKLHGEIDNLHAELMRLWAHSLGRIPFPKMR